MTRSGFARCLTLALVGALALARPSSGRRSPMTAWLHGHRGGGRRQRR